MTFPPATATDTNDNGNPTMATITYDINGVTSTSNMGYFPIGTTIVTATATDGGGNIDTCSFTVTVTKIGMCTFGTEFFYIKVHYQEKQMKMSTSF